MRPHILTCIHSFDLGGTERVALRLAEEWHRQGHEVTVAVGRLDGGTLSDRPRIRYAHAPATRLPVAAFETIWMIWWLWLSIRRLRPDVLFMPGNTYAVVAAAMRLLLGKACPPILLKVSNDLVQVHTNPVMARAYAWWCRQQGRVVDQFVALTEPMYGQVAERMAVAPWRINSIPNPVMTAAEQSAYASAGQRAVASRGNGRRFLAAGRLVPQKNFPLLIDAFAAMAWPEDRLVIVGEGPERAKLEAQIERLGLGRRVTLPGERAGIAECLADTDIFVLSSDYEGLPAVVVEALAAGLPIVATDCCISMRTLLDNGALGRIVPTGDRTALATAMALTQPALASRKRARAKAAQFGVVRAAAAYIEAFHELTGMEAQKACAA